MRHRRGKERLREVRVHVGLRREGAEKAGEVDDAHNAGEEHALGRDLRPSETGIAPLDLAVERRRARQHRPPIRRAEARIVPRHKRAIRVEPVGKVQRHELQILARNRLRFKAALCEEIVPVIVDAPEQAEARIDREAEGEQAQEHPVQAAQALRAADEADQFDNYVNQCSPDRQRIEEFCEGKGQFRRERGKALMKGVDIPGRELLHQGRVSLERGERADDPGGDQRDEMRPRADSPYGGGAAFDGSRVFHGRIVTQKAALFNGYARKRAAGAALSM